MKKRLFILLLMSCLFLTGCWDSTELNDIAVVSGMAIDSGKEHKYRLTVGYINPGQFSKQSQEQGAPVSIMTLEGNSLPEISARMNIGVSRKLNFSHTRALYISEEVAREGVSSFLDSIERSPQFRNDFNILIARGHEAMKFATINDPIEKVPSLKTKKQILNLVEGWGGAPRVRLADFIDTIISKKRSPVASTIIIEGDPEKGKNAESNMSIDPEANIVLDGMAVFKHDKLVGFLTLDDTRNYLWTQDLNRTMITIPCHEHGEDGEEGQYYDLVITNSKAGINSDYENGYTRLNVEIHTEARLNSMQCAKDLTAVSTYTELEERGEQYVIERIEGTIKKVQKEYGVDIFGFGEALYRQHPDKAKELEDRWDEEFAQGEVEVNVKIALRRSGIRNSSFLTKLPKEAAEE